MKYSKNFIQKNPNIQVLGYEQTTADGAHNEKSPIIPTSQHFCHLMEESLAQHSTLPTFSEEIGKELPGFIKECLERYKKPRGKGSKDMMETYERNQDMVTLAIIATMSSAMPNYQTLYRRQTFYTSIMQLIVARSGIGKGVLNHVFELLYHVNKQYRKIYEEKMKKYKQQQEHLKTLSAKERKNYKEELLENPAQSFFLLPADSTYAAFMLALARNKGMGALLDTEIDTLVNSFNSDLGDYSVLVRKNFTHEPHEYFRKTNEEYAEIEEPKFAILLSGTEDQLRNLVTQVSNGFFSRFCYYFNNTKPVWEDAEYDTEIDDDDKTFYRKKGEEVLKLFNCLSRLEKPVKFRLTQEQHEKLNSSFSDIHSTYIATEGDDIHGFIVRSAVILMRISMVLSMIRIIDKTEEELNEIFKNKIICSDKDFNTAMAITLALIQHGNSYYESLTGNCNNGMADDSNETMELGSEQLNNTYAAIPKSKTLSLQELLDIFIAHGFPESTARKKIKTLCTKLYIKKVKHGFYRKATWEEFLVGQNTKVKGKVRKTNKKKQKNLQ